MMFTRVAALVLAALPALAAATPVLESRGGGGGGGNKCSTGPVQCCDSVQSASSPSVQNLAGALGIPLSSLTGEVGLTCTPITVVGAGTGNTCHTNAVCCSDNNHDGLISLGCVPVSL